MVRKPVTEDDVANMGGSVLVYLSRADFFVEADEFSKHQLWLKHFGANNRADKLRWIKHNTSFIQVVGCVANAPEIQVQVHFSFATIGDRYICFYHPISRYVDWDIVERFIDTYTTIHHGNPTRCDANNFQKCYEFCEIDEFGPVDIDADWFVNAFDEATEAEGNSETAINIVMHETDSVLAFNFDVDCGRMGLHRDGSVIIDKVYSKVSIKLPDIIESGGIGTAVCDKIKSRLKSFSC